MAIHPQARAAIGAQPRVPLSRATLAASRASMRDAIESEVGEVQAPARVVDLVADDVPCRLYDDGRGRGVLVFVHGGGWALGDLDTHDGLCRRLATRSGWAVLAVDYRRAPECPYPAALEDVERAAAWLCRESPERFSIECGRLAIAGDSAGGHLAAVLARRARDRGAGYVHQTLVCPVIDPAASYPDLDGYGLSRDEMAFFWDAYAPPGTDRDSPDLAPLRADLRGLPPALVLTAEYDILRPEGEAYAAALAASGVPVVAVRYLGLNHGFVRKLALFDAAAAAVDQIAAGLRGLDTD